MTNRLSPMSLAAAVLPLHALAQETRWRIIELLLQREMCVGQMAGAMQLPQSSVSEHLGVMRKAGVIEPQRDGRAKRYRIARRFSDTILLLRARLGISEHTDSRLGADAWNASQGITA